jgi:acetolactate synthase small subunit
MNVIQTRIDRIGQGEKPIDNIMYIESTAVGVSLKEASDSLTNQLNELQTVFNVFDLSINRVIGRELYLLFRMNYVIPGIGELMDSFQIQK